MHPFGARGEVQCAGVRCLGACGPGPLTNYHLRTPCEAKYERDRAHAGHDSIKEFLAMEPVYDIAQVLYPRNTQGRLPTLSPPF